MKTYKSNIPPVVEVSGLMGETSNRNILLHRPTNTMVEVLEPAQIEVEDENRVYRFSFIDAVGVEEHLIMGIYHCGGDIEFVKAEWLSVLEEIAQYYITYCAWEDDNVLLEEVANNN